MNDWRQLRKYRYLLPASAAIIFATLALLFMQYRSVRNAEAQARATLDANLEIHLLELVDRSRRDTIDHANHIMHGIRQQRVRDRNMPSIERAFTRALRRYPEVENFYVVFFQPQSEDDSWQAYKFVAPDADDPGVQKFEGNPVGNMVEDQETSRSLLRAWKSIPKQDQTTLYAGFDSQFGNGNAPVQYFFHTVYELDTLKRQQPLSPVGLLVFSAKPNKFPSSKYYQNLINEYETDDKSLNPLIGKVNYKIDLSSKDSSEITLAKSSDTQENYRIRRFGSSDNLFPEIVFGVSTPIEANLSNNYIKQYTQTSIFLGLCAACLSIVGLILTWRATRREMKVAQLKTDFLASISHELKTPLTAIRAFGDLLHSGRARNPERIREYGELIKSESDRLTNLINNILEISRLERGIRRYRLEENSLTDTVSETVNFFRHTSEASEFTIKTNTPKLKLITCFDKNAIKQVLLNLLSNAVKYTDQINVGSKFIEVNLKQELDHAVIEVRDFGIGISPNEQRNIFDAFHRAQEDEVMIRRGTGLGLAIVREIIKGHGGEINVESEIGKGSVFRLYLPLIISSAASADDSPSTKVLKELQNG